MASILDFFEMYSTWIIVGAIIILLAIIGRYADKTNFGQNKKSEKNKTIDFDNELSKQEEPDSQINNNDNISIINEDLNEKNEIITPELLSDQNNIDDNNIDGIDSNNSENNSYSINEIQSKQEVTPDVQEKESDFVFEEEYNKYDKEIDLLLPKKEIIDEDLLDDIDNLSLDKTQKINVSEIPDLDDVDLPRIKNLNKQDQDIWKF